MFIPTKHHEFKPWQHNINFLSFVSIFNTLCKRNITFYRFQKAFNCLQTQHICPKSIKGLFWKHIGSPSDQRQVFGRGCVSTEIIGESISSNNYWVSDANTKYSVAHRGGVSIYFAESRFDSMFIHI